MSIAKHLAFGLGVGIITLGLAGADALAQNTRGGPMAGRGGPGGPRGAWGQGRGGPGAMLGPMGFPGALPMLAERLNLTDAQRDQVRSIVESHRDEMRTLADRTFAARTALRTVVVAEVVDEAAIRARSADLAAVEADAAVAHGRIHNEAWQILTPEQQDEARKLQTEMAERLAQHRERRSHQPPGQPGPRNRR